MFVAGGFRAIECVLDHGPPEQGRGQRVLSFDQLCRRIQQVVEISVDLRGTGQHQLGGDCIDPWGVAFAADSR